MTETYLNTISSFNSEQLSIELDILRRIECDSSWYYHCEYLEDVKDKIRQLLSLTHQQ